MTPLAFGFFIGRFQPFHEGHLHVIQQALERCESLIIVIGSAERARTVKNPWTFDERKELICANLPDDAKRLHFIASHDFFYNEAAWLDEIKTAVLALTQGQKVALIGHHKDHSTYYLNEFPGFDYIEVENYRGINATIIRAAYFLKEATPQALPGLSHITQTFLVEFQQGPHYERLAEEAAFIKKYKASWQHTPYPPLFVTTDSVVICNDHILLIQRKFMPGATLWAVPGGFVEQDERIIDGLIRELKEETSIGLSEDVLKEALQEIRVFDHPERSQIGRVITHAGLFKLRGDFPSVEAADDALEAKWVPLKKFWQMSDQLHDDHYQLVSALLKPGVAEAK